MQISISTLKYSITKFYTSPIRNILFLVLFICVQNTTAQIFHIPDSLKNKTYKELYKSQILYNNDSLKEPFYAKIYLHKAKNENDTIKIANAYTQFAAINNSTIAIKYYDSIIELTKNLNNFEYPGFGYMGKGIHHFNLGNDEIALENYLLAFKHADKHKNTEQLLYIKNSIGSLKLFFGSHIEALNNFKATLYILDLQNKNKENNHYSLYSNTLFNISNAYIISKKYDSALFYAGLGIQKSLNNSDTLRYYEFVSQTGYIAYYQNEFDRAIDSLDKAFPYENSSNGFLNNHYYRGNIYWKQGKDSLAFYHFKKADSIYNSTNEIVSEVSDIQEFFVNYYKKYNDTKNQLLYIDRLLYVDSIITKNYKNLNETLIKKYDTPLLLSEKEKIIEKLKTSEKKASYTIIGLDLLILVVIISFIWIFKKQQKSKKKPLNIQPIENKIILNKINKQTKNKEINNISKEVIKNVLKDLKQFEADNDFLENNLTLSVLSKKINTNSNYLSKIINTHKNLNFSSYISYLRIEYCLEKLKSDSKFRKYSITAIAFEIGFNNVESFSKAFYKTTNMYPSTFIKELKN